MLPGFTFLKEEREQKQTSVGISPSATLKLPYIIVSNIPRVCPAIGSMFRLFVANFDGNVGYSTPDHREAIAAHGVCALHRMSFASTAYSQLSLVDEPAA